MKRCPSLLNDTLQIVEDMNSLYIRQIYKKLQVHNVCGNMENDVFIPKTLPCNLSHTKTNFYTKFRTLLWF